MTDTNATDGDWVVIERTFAAPIDLVWKMWAEAEHFAAWYGPQGASIPVAEMDVRVGGTRLICMEMQTPDGPMKMWFTGEFTDVTPPQRLAYTDAMCDEDGTVKTPESMGMPPGSPTSTEVVVELTSEGEGTRMKMTHVGVPADSPGGMGWGMAIDKLEARLSESA